MPSISSLSHRASRTAESHGWVAKAGTLMCGQLLGAGWPPFLEGLRVSPLSTNELPASCTADSSRAGRGTLRDAHDGRPERGAGAGRARAVVGRAAKRPLA